jgi:hypothetical protein
MTAAFNLLALEPTVQSALVTGAGTVLVALIGVVAELLRRQHKALDAVKQHTEATHDQVQNGHPSNLRDDVDRLLVGVDQVLDGQARHDQLLRGHAAEIGGLRQELRHERAERLDVERRLNEHLRDA